MAATTSFDGEVTKAVAQAHLKRLGARKGKSKPPEWVLYNLTGGGQALVKSTKKADVVRLTVYVGQCPCEKLR